MRSAVNCFWIITKKLPDNLSPDSPSPAAQQKTLCCNVCGGALTQKFSRVTDPRSKEVFAIQACERCGLGQTQPAPTDPGAYYEASYHGGRHGFAGRYCARRRIRLLTQMVGAAKGRTILDIGCGDGTFLLYARDAGWNVVGTEMNPLLARNAGLAIETDLTAVEKRAPFDCITLWHSLEHMQDVHAIIDFSRKLLHPRSGLLLLAVPDAGGLQANCFGNRWFHLDVPRHLYHFTYQSLQKLLESTGFDLVRSWHQEFEYDLLGWTQSTLNRLLPIPNIFFDQLTHRKSEAGALQRAASWLGGVVVSAGALPLLALGTLIRRGGTLIVAAKIRNNTDSG